MQDHKVFAHHEKWGTFQVPEAFLNTNNNAPVRQARWTCPSILGLSKRNPIQYTCPLLPNTSMVMYSRRQLCACVQVSNRHGWHGVRKMARANEQQKQQEKQQQQQKQEQKQKQQRQKQEQKRKQEQQKRKQEQKQNGGGETGAPLVDDVKARVYPTICAHAAYLSCSHVCMCWFPVRRAHRRPSWQKARPLCRTSGGGSEARRWRSPQRACLSGTGAQQLTYCTWPRYVK